MRSTGLAAQFSSSFSKIAEGRDRQCALISRSWIARTQRARTCYYYRRNGRRIRIPGEFGSPKFLAEYQRIHRQFAVSDSQARVIPGSMLDLIHKYKGSEKFDDVAPSTRKDYLRYLDYLGTNFGHLAAATLPRPFVLELKALHRKTKRKQGYILQVLRILMNHAINLRWRTDNPAAKPGIKQTERGHRPWEEDELAPFRTQWTLGTLERTGFELMLQTGQRGCDAVKMRWSDIKDGMIHVYQLKTGARVWIPLSLDLQEALASWKSVQEQLRAAEVAKGKIEASDRDEFILVGQRGRHLSTDRFRHVMIDAYRAVEGLAHGLASEGVTTHGLRSTAATILREIGCDWEEIASITGHDTVAMVRKYSERKRKAKRAIAKLDAARLANE